MNHTKNDIKELLKKYLEKDKDAINEFWSIYSLCIYNFPLKIFHSDEDTASDFFLYAFEKLKNGEKFASFDMNQNFDTWFYVVLRNLFFSMLRNKHDIETTRITITDKDGEEIASIEDFEDRTQKTFYQSIEEKEFLFYLKDILKTLKIEFRIILKLELLYYFDFDNIEIKEISNSSGKTILDILQKISTVRKELEQKSCNINNKEILISRVFSIKTDIERLLDKINKKKDRKDDKKELELKRKLEKRKKQFTELLKEKEKGAFIVKTPHKEIAEILSITVNTVNIRLHKAQKALKECLSKGGIDEKKITP